MPRRIPSRSFPKRKRMEHPNVERAQHPQALQPAKTLHVGVYGGTTRPAPKPETYQSEAYMRLVRTFACERCGRPGPSEFAHADQGKGQGVKSDCREGTSLCGYRSPEDPGCHWLVGTRRIYPRDVRRDLEKVWARNTRARVLASGKWPKTLPMWSEQ